MAVALLGLGAVAMPTSEELEKVRPIIDELTADDVAALKSGKKSRTQYADALLAYVGEAESEAAKFALVQDAFKSYMGAFDAEKAAQAFDMLSGNVKDVPPGTFGRWCRPHVVPFAKGSRAVLLAKLLDKAVDSGDADSTTMLMNDLKPFMRKLGAGGKRATTPFAVAAERANRQIRRAREAASLKAAVRKSPGDASVHEKYALALASLGNWPAALKEFESCGGDVAEAAKWERKWPKPGESGWAPAKSAELWWDRSCAAKDDDVAAALRGRSVAWYKIAIDKGELTGLRKTIAEKRIREAEQLGVAFVEAVSAAPAAAPAAVAKKDAPASAPAASVAAAAPAVAAAPANDAKWTLPKMFNVPLERSLDLDGGVKMPFCAIPPGSFNMVGHKVTLTRPFWISKTMLSLHQLAALPYWKSFITSKKNVETGEKTVQQFKDRAIGISIGGNSSAQTMAVLNEKFKAILPPGYVFRLPTEAEFYYAYCDGKDDTNYPHNPDNIMVNTGEAYAGVGWVERVDEWKWDSLPLEYRWIKFLKLPSANHFGFVAYRGMGTGYQFLDRIEFDFEGKWTRSFKTDADLSAALKYEAEEVDPLRRTGDVMLLGGGGYTPRVRYMSKDSSAFVLVVIGPDLVSEKK